MAEMHCNKIVNVKNKDIFKHILFSCQDHSQEIFLLWNCWHNKLVYWYNPKFGRILPLKNDIQIKFL